MTRRPNRMTLLVLPLLLLTAAVWAALPDKWSAREKTVARAITAPALAAHTRYLASDLLEGRGPGARGDELAMSYVAAEFERMGLAPGGDADGGLRSWRQTFDIVGLRASLTKAPTFTGASGKAVTLVPGTDVVIGAVEEPHVTVNGAPLVFVGYGIDAPEQKWNDFKDADLRGKVLVVMNNDPSTDPALFAGKTRLFYGRWTYKLEEAKRKGALGALIIHTTPSAGYPWQVVQTSWGREGFALPGDTSTGTVNGWLTEDAARRLATLGGHDLDQLRAAAEQRDFRPVPLGVTLSTAWDDQVRHVKTANVMGILPGRDPVLSDEMVIVSAHHDHLGIGTKKNGDDIYNGALDNASGVAALLTIAEGMSRLQPAPRRSILFTAVGVEESGLLGSAYLAAHPPIPAGKIAADFNIDGINIWGRTRDIAYVGLGKSSLDGVVINAAAQQGRKVIGDNFPDRGHFYRSDQFSFARVGIPSVYFDAGGDFVGQPAGWGAQQIERYEAERYHQPSDQIDSSWKLDGAVEDEQLMGVVALRTAEADQMPTWKPGDEFEAARKAAIKAAK